MMSRILDVVLVLSAVVLTCLTLWLFAKSQRELTHRNVGKVYGIFRDKLMSEGRLRPTALKKQVDRAITSAEMVNVTSLRPQANYQFVDRLGNEFNLPVRGSGSNLEKIEEEEEEEDNGGASPSTTDFMEKFRFLVLEEYSKLFGWSENVSFSAPLLTSLCQDPVEVDGSVDCRIFCRDDKAVKFENTLAVYRGELLQPEKTYCYVPLGGTETEPPSPEEDESGGARCSQYAGVLTWIANRERWLCHCTYPFLFKGPHCTESRACRYEPLKHRENPNWKNEVYLVDETNPSVAIVTHGDLAKSSLFKTLRNASYKQYQQHINDPYFFLKNRISCSCKGQLDYLGNALPQQQSLNRDFLDFTKCHVDPCKLTRLDEKVVTYDPVRYACDPTDPDLHENVVMGDRGTPFAGEVPLFGLRKRKVEPEATSGELKNAEKGLTKEAGERIASMVGPVITPKNADHTDRSRFVIYFSPDQINLAGKSSDDLKRHYALPEIYGQYGDSLPNLTNRAVNATAAYHVYPVENVLADHTPQNPVDLNLLAAQAMENSFMVSGMVLGGHEVLFHSIFDEAAKTGLEGATQKMRDMFTFFKVTRLGAGKVMTSLRLKEPSRPAAAFADKISSLCRDVQKDLVAPPHARQLNAAASVRSYRVYGLLDSLSNLNDSYDVGALASTRSMHVQLAFPTSLYKLNEEAHFYRDSSKMISNQLKFTLPSAKSLNSVFNLSFSSERRRTAERVEHRQYADLWVPNDMSLQSAAKGKGELFDRNLVINENVTPNRQREFFNNLRKKKVRPLNLHHILAVSNDNFGETMTRDPIVRKHYMETSKVAASLTWSSTFDTKYFDSSLIFEKEEDVE